MARKNYPLRISPELYAALERWAADDLRSVNAQIEYLLTQMAREAGRLKSAAEQQQKPETPTDQGPENRSGRRVNSRLPLLFSGPQEADENARSTHHRRFYPEV